MRGSASALKARAPATVARAHSATAISSQRAIFGSTLWCTYFGGCVAVLTHRHSLVALWRSSQISAGEDPKRQLFTFAFSETLRARPPQAPRRSQVVQNQRILVQTRPPRPGGVVNKTQPKAPLPQEGFGMKVQLYLASCCGALIFGHLSSLNVVHITSRSNVDLSALHTPYVQNTPARAA